jgi:hypothetical protein
MAANLIASRGNRATAVLLGWLEENVYQFLPPEVQTRTRQIVLDNINQFKDLAIDIVKSDTAYMNELWLEKVDEMHQSIRQDLRNYHGVSSGAH